MKIDFNGKGMTINFDKVPSLLFFSEEDHGCGKVFINGQQRKGIVDIKIHAHTDGPEVNQIDYIVEYYDKSSDGMPVLNQIIKGKPFPYMHSVSINLMDIEEVRKIIDELRHQVNVCCKGIEKTFSTVEFDGILEAAPGGFIGEIGSDECTEWKPGKQEMDPL